MTLQEINKTIHDWRAGNNKISQDSLVLDYNRDLNAIRWAVRDLSDEKRGEFMDRLRYATSYPVEYITEKLSSLEITPELRICISKLNDEKLFFSDPLIQCICLLRIIKPDFRESSRSEIEVRDIIARAAGWRDIIGDYGIICNRIGLDRIKDGELKMDFHERIPDYHRFDFAIKEAESNISFQRLLSHCWYNIKTYVITKYFGSRRYGFDYGDPLLTCDLLVEALECEQKILSYLKKENPAICPLGDGCVSQKTLGVLCRCDLELHWPFILSDIPEILEKVEKK